MLSAAISKHDHDIEVLREQILGDVDGAPLALMLYGSHARGDSRGDSDIDVLEIVARRAPSYRKGKLSVTRYTARHLHALAEAGSLFVLHLCQEGEILLDPSGLLASVLKAYRQPTGYEELERTLSVTAKLLDIDEMTFARNPEGFARAAFYLLRSVVYVRLAERGSLTFSLAKAAMHLHDPRLYEAFLRKDHPSRSFAELVLLRELLAKYLGQEIQNEFGSLEALVVHATGKNPLTAPLAIRLLSGKTTIGYELLGAGDEPFLDA
jgi:hypothetical protein